MEGGRWNRQSAWNWRAVVTNPCTICTIIWAFPSSLRSRMLREAQGVLLVCCELWKAHGLCAEEFFCKNFINSLHIQHSKKQLTPVWLQCRRCVLIFIYFSFFKGWLLEGCIEKQVSGLSGEYCWWRTIFFYISFVLCKMMWAVFSIWHDRKPHYYRCYFIFGTKCCNRKWPQPQFPWLPVTWIQSSRRWKAKAAFW